MQHMKKIFKCFLKVENHYLPQTVGADQLIASLGQISIRCTAAKAMGSFSSPVYQRCKFVLVNKNIFQSRM
jgi:hypothetical protein